MVIVVGSIARCVIFGVPRLPIRPCDERPPAMDGHLCLVPRVSVHDRYYCIENNPIDDRSMHRCSVLSKTNQWTGCAYNAILSMGDKCQRWVGTKKQTELKTRMTSADGKYNEGSDEGEEKT